MAWKRGAGLIAAATPARKGTSPGVRACLVPDKKGKRPNRRLSIHHTLVPARAAQLKHKTPRDAGIDGPPFFPQRQRKGPQDSSRSIRRSTRRGGGRGARGWCFSCFSCSSCFSCCSLGIQTQQTPSAGGWRHLLAQPYGQAARGTALANAPLAPGSSKRFDAARVGLR